MNPTTTFRLGSHQGSCCSKLAWFIGAIVLLAVFAGLTSYVAKQDNTASLDSARGQERWKAQAEVKAANSAVLNSYAMIDVNKGQVRLPVTRAMELIASEYSDTTAGRQKLLQRLDNSLKQVSFE